MSLVSDWLSKAKWYIIAGIFVVYSGALWHVSSTYTSSSYVKAELVRTTQDNKLAQSITQKLDDIQGKYNEIARANTKDLLDELLKDPRYKSCLVTDGVRSAIQRKLDAQPK